MTTFRAGDYVYVTDSKLYEGASREEINTSYEVSEIYELDLDKNDAHIKGVELKSDGPFYKFMLTTESIELDSTRGRGSNKPVPQESDTAVTGIDKVFSVFKESNGAIKPNFFITGPTGSGKTFSVQTKAKELGIDLLTISAAQLTTEGTSGNSLSKVLTPLANRNTDRPLIIFVDEFDKLFISNATSETKYSSSMDVQNEFLQLLEADTTEVSGDYGKFITADLSKVLFIFAGSFRGDVNITVDSLKAFGISAEFLGRVPLMYTTKKAPVECLTKNIDTNPLLLEYLKLHKGVSKEIATRKIKLKIEAQYPTNMMGFRLLDYTIHKHFIDDIK